MKLSLAGWSLQKQFRSGESPLRVVDFAKYTRDTFGLDAVELNNIFFESTKSPYLDQVRLAAEAAGVTLLNIAVDEHGDLASLDPVSRAIAVANYARWIPIARYLGIAAIRANSGGTHVTNQKAAVECCTDSFRQLCDVGQKHGVRVLIENHWGLSYDPQFIVTLVRHVRLTHGEDAIAVLADFGNWPDEVDRYDALTTIMPYAAAVHAKVNDIDEHLRHPRFDHARCIEIAKDAGYDGYLGIEFESETQDAVEGITRGVRRLRQLIA